MTRIAIGRGTFACALLATTALAAAPARAQGGQPAYRTLDANGVDLVRGDYVLAFAEGSIGSGPSELALLRQVTQNGQASQWDLINFSLTRPSAGGTETVSVAIGNIAESFTGSAGSYTSTQRNGGTLTGSGGSFTYTARDGTQIAFADPTGNPMGGATNFCKDTSQTSCTLLPATIDAPDGKTLTLGWTTNERCSRTFNDDGSLDCQYDGRLASVANGYGYAIGFAYASDTGGSPPPSTWYRRTGASFTNAAVSSAAQAGVAYAYPATGVVAVTDTGGNVWEAGPGYIRRPGASSNSLQVTGTVGSSLTAVHAGVTTTYSRSVSGTTATMTITNALSQATTVVSDLNVGRPTSVTDPLSHTTSYQYDTYGRLTRVTQPEGNYVQLTLDARGNVTQTDYVPKPGSGLSTLTATASYPSSCAGNVACNQPTSTTDARGKTTTYDWDTATGLLNSVTAPPPTTGAVAPQTRYGYSVGSDGVSQAVAVSQCRTGSAPSCVGTVDETVTTLAYDASGNVTSRTVAAGDSSLSATTAMTYDALGNLSTVDGPLSGTADTTRYRYNGSRQLVGIVSPDPDGAGPLKHRAVRATYTNGLLTKVEQGTVNSPSDSDWAAFSSQGETDTAYDANARPVTQSLVAGSTTYSLVQTSYDSLGRVDCVATRMNSAAFGALPSSACTLGTASTAYGPDRIVKAGYDADGRPTKRTLAYGTSDQADDATATYTANDKLQTLTDGEGNKTTYVYDGLDRLYQTQYPSSTKGAGTSNSLDYEQLGYDENGNVTARRTRANEWLSYGYDALNRLFTKTVPTSASSVAGYTVYYGYDLQGRMTYARFGSASGPGITNTFDALGRLTSTSTDMSGSARTLSYQWDLHGNRTRVTHPDGAYAAYHYDGLDRMKDVWELTNVAIATYTYDDTGARVAMGHYNNWTTTYGHDGIGRLTGLGHLQGSTTIQSYGFAYNPAGQIVGRTGTNDAFAWTGHYNVNRGYTANGLNQYTASGSANPTYDGNGNLVSDDTNSFAYDAENHLVTASGAANATLAYDPLGRLWQQTSGTATTQFLYDGDALVSEFSPSGAILRRYAHGDGADEPVGWYEGTLAPRGILADERGSVIGAAPYNGGLVVTNTYDEYGNPRSSNAGRFQYTGQAWLPEVGLYYYKARFYSPSMGRFMQTDPVGYGAGMNWYNYVGSDPVNYIDPSGLRWVIVCVHSGDNPATGWRCGRHWLPDGDSDSGSRLAGGTNSLPPGGVNLPGNLKEGGCPTAKDSDGYFTREDAGLAAAQALRAQQRAAHSNDERSYATKPTANGFGFLPTGMGEPCCVPLSFSPSFNGTGHLHLGGGGSRLSGRRDEADKNFGGDHDLENINRALDVLEAHGVDVAGYAIFLAGEDGNVYEWTGRHLTSRGKVIGPDTCKPD